MIKIEDVDDRKTSGRVFILFLQGITWVCITLLLSNNAYAQFTPDFISDNGGSQSTFVVHGNSSIGGQTPYLEEVVYDPATGLDYYHLLIGNPADGFAQDIYIERGFASFPNGGVGSASGGGSLNATDVFASGNGTNTGNPNKVIVRQILNDGEIAQEFLKNKLNTKPKISQMLNAPDIASLFIVDMSNSTYSDNSIAGTVVNTLTLVDPYLDAGIGDFTMSSDGLTTTTIGGGQAADQQSSQITAGRYIYTNGSGPGASGGVYTYLFDGYDPYAVDVVEFFDSTEANPWSYTTNRPQ